MNSNPHHSVALEEPAMGRRQFLRLSGGLGLSLGLLNLTPGCAALTGEAMSGELPPAPEYSGWESIYREEWKWDRVSWGSHTNQCFPGGCSFRVYARDGVVWREEQTADSEACDPAYPDFNPQGCQKGCGFHHLLSSGERLQHPLKRVGERGEGKWRRISWDEALGEIADAILDAHESAGTESFVVDAPHIHAGSVAFSGAHRLSYMLNGLTTDVNVALGDDLKGILHTFGKMQLGYSAENLLDAELIIVTNGNPSYTMPPGYHFFTEARYNGSEIVLLAPDYSASALAADIHVPLRVATDAAFWLAISQVILSEGLEDRAFIREQTDLALLVRSDDGRYLRADDVDGGREDQLYFLDQSSGQIVPAPRGTLAFDGVQALEGRYMARLADGETVEVAPVFENLKQKLDREYTPEQAAAICGVSPEVIRSLARKVATRRTCSYIGFSSAKHFHGDLQERSLLLAMALSGNWGKPGTGFNQFLIPVDHMELLIGLEKPASTWELLRIRRQEKKLARELRKQDPEISDELVATEFRARMTQLVGIVPPIFWLYNHVGYKKYWDREEWSEPTQARPFGEYLRESVERKYWNENQSKPTASQQPKVLMLMAHNPLRRQRSGRQMYVEELFPKLDLIFGIETRMSSSAAFADILLPAAWYYEKADLTLTFAFNRYTALIEQAVAPRGESLPEWEIFARLSQKIAERAGARGMTDFRDRMGKLRRYADLEKRFTIDGHLRTQEDVVREFVRINEKIGTFPKRTSFDVLKRKGQVPFTGFGAGYQKHAAATDVDPSKPYTCLTWHLDKQLPYPTYARRAQFYLEHEWYLEAGEALPTHKETPPVGGMHPFRIVSGHIRGSIHCLHIATPELAKLHRGQPVLFVNDRVAAAKNVADGDRVRVFNDVEEFEVMVSTSAAVGPDQVVIYMWEPHQFKDWKSHDSLLVGMPKGIHMAGSYGQLRHFFSSGTPTPASDRGLRVDFEPA